MFRYSYNGYTSFYPCLLPLHNSTRAFNNLPPNGKFQVQKWVSRNSYYIESSFLVLRKPFWVGEWLLTVCEGYIYPSNHRSHSPQFNHTSTRSFSCHCVPPGWSRHRRNCRNKYEEQSIRSSRSFLLRVGYKFEGSTIKVDDKIVICAILWSYSGCNERIIYVWVRRAWWHHVSSGKSACDRGFPKSHVQMWELGHIEDWAPKNWCFQIVVLEETLEDPLDWREINQSILKEINSEQSLEGLMLKLKLQSFGHLMWRANSLEKILMLGKIEGRRRKGRQRVRWLDGSTGQWTWVWANSRRWWRTGDPGVLQSMRSQRVRHNWATEQQQQPPLSPDPLRRI